MLVEICWEIALFFFFFWIAWAFPLPHCDPIREDGERALQSVSVSSIACSVADTSVAEMCKR
jgi:hypothetical protein